ncbi:MAG: methylamine utilization protein [Chthoniobacterales bacterium]
MKKELVAVLMLALSALPSSRAGTLTITVTDNKGGPVPDAVVYATPQGNAKLPARSHSAIVDQRNQQFVPYVIAIQVGTAVTFPNHDNIRHHVYSFSPAKRFELPLYAGIPAEPVLFDKEGIVTLGCNIHDWMLAYIAVLRTPYFQVTPEEGRASLKNLPAASYRVEIWQPRMKASPEQLAQTVELSGTENKELTFHLDLKPDWRSRKAPALNPEDYH